MKCLFWALCILNELNKTIEDALKCVQFTQKKNEEEEKKRFKRAVVVCDRTIITCTYAVKIEFYEAEYTSKCLTAAAAAS